MTGRRSRNISRSTRARASSMSRWVRAIFMMRWKACARCICLSCRRHPPPITKGRCARARPWGGCAAAAGQWHPDRWRRRGHVGERSGVMTKVLLQIFSGTVLGQSSSSFIQRKGDEGFGEGQFSARCLNRSRKTRSGVAYWRPDRAGAHAGACPPGVGGGWRGIGAQCRCRLHKRFTMRIHSCGALEVLEIRWPSSGLREGRVYDVPRPAHVLAGKLSGAGAQRRLPGR